MMHVRFNEAWHGKVHKQPYKSSGAQYATPLHIDETPHSLFSSLSVRYPTILNVLNMVRGEAKENYLSRQV